MTIDMNVFGRGKQKPGNDYSSALIDILPGLISETPMTKWQIAEAAGRSHATVNRVIERERAKMHIAGWVRGKSGPITPAWKWGEGEDAPRPEPYSKPERNRRFRATEHGRLSNNRSSRNWRKTENGKEYTAAYSKRRYAREKFEKKGVAAFDPLLAAIMGVKK